MRLPEELRSSKKGIIIIKKKDQKCFLCFHDRHINPVKINPERIVIKKIKKLVKNLDYDGIEFPMREKDFSKIETKKNICINVFCYENRLVFPIYISDLKFESTMDFLLLINGDKSHDVYIKGFDR